MSYIEDEKKRKLIKAIQNKFASYQDRPLKDLFQMLKGLTPDKIKSFIINVYQSHVYKETEQEENDKALIAEIKEKF